MRRVLSPRMSPLHVTNVHKTYRQGGRDVRALRGVSVDVNRGQFLAIMGASGSGKSTLLHLMGGLTKPDSGEVSVDGEALAPMSDGKLTRFRRDHIGLVFQSFNLIPTLSARENVLTWSATASRPSRRLLRKLVVSLSSTSTMWFKLADMDKDLFLASTKIPPENDLRKGPAT